MRIEISGYVSLTSEQVEEFREYINNFFNIDFQAVLKDNKILFIEN